MDIHNPVLQVGIKSWLMCLLTVGLLVKAVQGLEADHKVCPNVPTASLENLNCTVRENKCNSHTECKAGKRCCPVGSQCGVMCRNSQQQKSCPIPVDLAVLLDSSYNVTTDNWKKVLRFAADLVDSYDVSVEGSRVGVITYSKYAKVDLPFNAFGGVELNAVNIKRRILGIKQQRDLTFIDKALKLANKELFNVKNGMRPDQKQICLVLAGGSQTKKKGPFTKLGVASAPLKARGIDVYALGVGPGIDVSELTDMVTRARNVFTTTSFEALNEKVKPMVTAQCSGCIESIDLVFGIPVSSDIGNKLFNVRQFFAKMVGLFTIDTTQTHVGIVEYSNRARMSLHLDTYYNSKDIKDFINNIKPRGLMLRVDKAIDAAVDTAFTIYGGVRQTIPKVFLLFLPMNSTSSVPATKVAADKLKTIGVRLMIVGLRNAIHRWSLSSVVSRPSAKFLVSSDSYAGFGARVNNIAGTICKAEYGECPLPGNAIKCPMFVSHECSADGDCTDDDMKCCRRGCLNKCVPVINRCFVPMDVVFLLDNSEMVSSKNYDFMKGLIKDVIMSLANSEKSANFAIGQYARRFEKGTERFRNFRSTAELHTLVDKLAQSTSSAERNLGAALRGVASNYFSVRGGMRQGVPRVLVILASSNPSPISESISSAVEDLNSANVRRVAIGFTSDAELAFLQELATDSSLIFRTDEPQQLESVIGKLTTKLCQEKPGSCPGQPKPDPVRCGLSSFPANRIPCGNSAGKIKRTQKENDWDCPGEQKCCRDEQGCHFLCTPPPLSCSNHKDILFLVESTNLIGENGFSKIKKFISKMVEKFDISRNTSHVAMATYTGPTIPAVQFKEATAWNKEAFINEVEQVKFTGGREAMASEALEMASKHIFTERFGAREYVMKAIVLIGTGRIDNPTKSVFLAKRLRKDYIETFAVTIGNYADHATLSEIVPRERFHVFPMTSVNALDVQLRPLVKTVCFGSLKRNYVDSD